MLEKIRQCIRGPRKTSIVGLIGRRDRAVSAYAILKREWRRRLTSSVPALSGQATPPPHFHWSTRRRRYCTILPSGAATNEDHQGGILRKSLFLCMRTETCLGPAMQLVLQHTNFLEDNQLLSHSSAAFGIFLLIAYAHLSQSRAAVSLRRQVRLQKSSYPSIKQTLCWTLKQDSMRSHECPSMPPVARGNAQHRRTVSGLGRHMGASTSCAADLRKIH